MNETQTKKEMNGAENMNENYEEFTIPRTNKPPLILDKAVLLSGGSNQWISGKEKSRWDEYNIYKTKSGKVVIEHQYKTRYQGEANRYEAWVGNDLEDTLAKFKQDLSNTGYERDDNLYPQPLLDAIDGADMTHLIAERVE